VLGACIASAPAGADGPAGSLDGRIAAARAREAELQREVGTLTSQIRGLERRAGDVAIRLDSLQRDLELHQRRLASINELLQAQSEQLSILRKQNGIATQRLSRRVVSLYEDDTPSAIELVLDATSVDDALARIDYVNAIATQDAQIVAQVRETQRDVRRARARTNRMRARVSSATRVIEYRRNQVAALRNSLLAERQGLAASRISTERELASTRAQEQEWIAEANALAQASAAVASELGSSAGSSAPSTSGLIWPVSGPITSPFGMRWGSLHPGIDIAAGTGTPIRAAASGHVVSAAYSGGYGYLTVIDHGSGLATAYAHQSRLGTSAGAAVSQGQVIGYVGSTGFSTGPHLHFEVRVNGSPVDPLGYL
jgi:murein DD-endopeptidase MepM/ murein hydrolase activator NlpD